MKLTIQELQRQIRRGPGLVIGPGLTTSGSREAECFNHIRRLFPNYDNESPAPTYLDYADLILAKGDVPEINLRLEVQSHFSNSAFANPHLPTIVKANWTAVVSLCSDDFFRTKLGDYLYATPTKWTLTTIGEPSITLPLATVPYYCLMGDIRDNRDACAFAISKSQLLRRQRVWLKMLSSLPHILKSDPLIFLGTGAIVERVCDFINELMKLQPQIPKRLIFLENDPTAGNALFKNLVGTQCQIEVATCSLSDLGNYLSRQSLSIYSLPLFADITKAIADPRAFSEIEDQVAYVPRRQEVKANREERNRLLDSLFKPTHLDWAPYAFDLEFKRDICSNVVERIKALFLQKGNDPRVIQIKGEAGIGKTVVCRTVAFDLAQKNYLCFWIKRSYGELSGSRFDAVVTKLNEAIKKPGTEVVFFLDDPAGSRVTLNEAVAALGRAQFRWVLVVSSRKTDDVSLRKDRTGPPDTEAALDVPTDFTDPEMARLPEYLVALGVATTAEIAENMMIPKGLRHSRDVLCSLWYMLPQTHAAIEDSLVGEYRRLGDVEEYVRQFADAAGGAKSIAKAAYEFVTTTSGFENAPLPVEVLVSALGVSYGEWGQQCKEQKPLWGLLYDEQYPSAETYAYRTRNHVVTDVLLRTLNHGTSGHTGEYRCLRALLSACTSSTPQYKRFLWDILVDRRHLIEKRFNYVQAVELYDAALKAFPRQLGVIEHQRSIVKRHLGGDALEVYEELRKLIARTSDRAIADQDSVDNLHTSAAATLNQLIKEGKADAAETAETVFEHISSALAIDQFSLHSHHVHAKTLLTIATELRNTNKRAFMANLERAARITSRGLALVQQASAVGRSGRSLGESVQLFDDLKQELFMAHVDIHTAQTEAKELFEQTGEQVGLAFVCRMLLAKATAEGKGQLFKKTDDYLRECFKLVATRGKEASDELLLCRIELVVNWNLNQNKGPIYWEEFESDLHRIVRSPRYAADVMWTFYLGVAEYNLRKFQDADGRFQWLRSRNLPWQLRNIVRCYYLGDGGAPKVLEGKIGHGSHDRFIYSAELGNDVLVRKDDFRERPDEIKHFTIGFSFNGPIARGRNPD